MTAGVTRVSSNSARNRIGGVARRIGRRLGFSADFQRASQVFQDRDITTPGRATLLKLYNWRDYNFIQDGGSEKTCQGVLSAKIPVPQEKTLSIACVPRSDAPPSRSARHFSLDPTEMSSRSNQLEAGIRRTGHLSPLPSTDIIIANPSAVHTNF